jgi:hypothetical protein
MRIAHVITGLNVGGAETMLYRLISGMDREYRRADSGTWHTCQVLEHGQSAEPYSFLGVRLLVKKMEPSSRTNLDDA